MDKQREGRVFREREGTPQPEGLGEVGGGARPPSRRLLELWEPAGELMRDVEGGQEPSRQHGPTTARRVGSIEEAAAAVRPWRLG